MTALALIAQEIAKSSMSPQDKADCFALLAIIARKLGEKP